MPQTNDKTQPFTVNQQAHSEKDLIEVGLVTGQKLYLSPSTARMLACDLIQAAYQAEMHNTQRTTGTAQKAQTPSHSLSVVAAA